MSSFAHMSVPNQRNQPRGRYFSNVARNLNSMRITAGKGVKVSQTGSGVTISAKGGVVNGDTINVSGDANIAVVNGGSALAGYAVSLYGNGLDAPPTSTGTLHLPECSAYSSVDLPAGTVLLAHSTMVITTGGSET